MDQQGELASAATGSAAQRGPLVTVVMPVHNAGPHLEPAIRSVLDQTMADLELVIAHDASTDGSGALARRIASTDPRVTVIETGGVGPGGARNAAIAVARGTYLAMCDHDDVCHPERLARQLEAAGRDPSVLLWGSSTTTIDSEGRRIGRAVIGPPDLDAWAREQASHRPVMLQGPTFLGRTTVFRRHLYRDSLCDDFDLSDRVSCEGPVIELDDDLVAYRVHEGAATTARHREQCLHLRHLWHNAERRSRSEAPEDYGQFLAAYRAEPATRRLYWQLLQDSRLHLRRATIARASGKRSAMVWNLALAVATNPGYAVHRVWNRVLVPMLARRRSSVEPQRAGAGAASGGGISPASTSTRDDSRQQPSSRTRSS